MDEKKTIMRALISNDLIDFGRGFKYKYKSRFEIYLD
jgi:hypothetical protein